MDRSRCESRYESEDMVGVPRLEDHVREQPEEEEQLAEDARARACLHTIQDAQPHSTNPAQLARLFPVSFASLVASIREAVHSPKETTGPLGQRGQWWIVFAICIGPVCLTVCFYFYAFCYSARNEGSDEAMSKIIRKSVNQDLPRPRATRRSDHHAPTTRATHTGHTPEGSEQEDIPAVRIRASAPHRQLVKHTRYGHDHEADSRRTPRETSSSHNSNQHHLEVPHPE